MGEHSRLIKGDIRSLHHSSDIDQPRSMLFRRRTVSYMAAPENVT